jgi:hypothetical protein
LGKAATTHREADSFVRLHQKGRLADDFVHSFILGFRDFAADLRRTYDARRAPASEAAARVHDWVTRTVGLAARCTRRRRS